jgi:hypothetical protein
MGTQELTHAYPRLHREWVLQNHGTSLRLTNPARKGVPDFLLSHTISGPIMCEVKSVLYPTDNIGLAYEQAKILDDFALHGTNAKVLCLCISNLHWGIFYAGTLKTHYKSLKYNMAAKQTVFLTPEFMKGI